MIMAASNNGASYHHDEQNHRKQSHCEIEKRRRDKMNHYITELASVIPAFSNNSSKLDKLTVLRLAVQHVKSLRSSLCSFSSFHLRPSFLSSGDLLKNLILQMASLEAQDNLFMVVTCDRGKVLFVSESSKDILNQEQDELVGQCLFDILHKDDVSKVKEQISHFNLAPNKMLVDSKTLQPIRSNQRQSFWRLQNQANNSSALQPGARRSFFCRMKSGRIWPPQDPNFERQRQAGPSGQADSSSAGQRQQEHRGELTNLTEGGGGVKRFRDGSSSSKQNKLEEERESHRQRQQQRSCKLPLEERVAASRPIKQESGEERTLNNDQHNRQNADGEKRQEDYGFELTNDQGDISKCSRAEAEAEATPLVADGSSRRPKKAQAGERQHLHQHHHSRSRCQRLTRGPGVGADGHVRHKGHATRRDDRVKFFVGNDRLALDSQGGSVSGDSGTSSGRDGSSGGGGGSSSCGSRQMAPSSAGAARDIDAGLASSTSASGSNDSYSSPSSSSLFSLSPPPSGVGRGTGDSQDNETNSTTRQTSSGTDQQAEPTTTAAAAAAEQKSNASLGAETRKCRRPGGSGCDRGPDGGSKIRGADCCCKSQKQRLEDDGGQTAARTRDGATIAPSSSSSNQPVGTSNNMTTGYNGKHWRYIVMHCTGYLKQITLRNDEYDEDDFDERTSELNSDAQAEAADDDAEDCAGLGADSDDDSYARPTRRGAAEHASFTSNGTPAGASAGIHDGTQFRTVNCLVAVCRRSVMDRDLKPNRPLTFTCRYSMEGKFVFVDQRTTVALGYTPQQLIGTSHYAYCHKDSVNTFKECHRQCILKPETVSSDIYQFKRANGQHLWLQTSLKSFRNPWTKFIDYIVANHTTAEGNDPRYNEGCVPTKFNRDMTLAPTAPNQASGRENNCLAVGELTNERCHGGSGSGGSRGSASSSALASASSQSPQSPQSSSPLSSSSQLSSSPSQEGGSASGASGSGASGTGSGADSACCKKAGSPSSSESMDSSHSLDSYASGTSIQALLKQIDRVRSGGLRHSLEFSHSKKQRGHHHNHHHNQHHHRNHHHHHHHHHLNQNSSSSNNRSSGASNSSGARKSNDDSGNFSDLRSCSSISSQTSNLSPSNSGDYLRLQNVSNFVDDAASGQVGGAAAERDDESVSPPRAQKAASSLPSVSEYRKAAQVERLVCEQLEDQQQRQEQEQSMAAENEQLEEQQGKEQQRQAEEAVAACMNEASTYYDDDRDTYALQTEQQSQPQPQPQPRQQQQQAGLEEARMCQPVAASAQLRPNETEMEQSFEQQGQRQRHQQGAVDAPNRQHANQFLTRLPAGKSPQVTEGPRMMNVRSLNGSRPLIAASIAIRPLQSSAPYQYSFRPPPIMQSAPSISKSNLVGWQQPQQQGAMYRRQAQAEREASNQATEMCISMSAGDGCSQQQEQQAASNYMIQHEQGGQQRQHNLDGLMQVSAQSSGGFMGELAYAGEPVMQQQYLPAQMSGYQLQQQPRHQTQQIGDTGHHLHDSMTMTMERQHQQQPAGGSMVPMIWSSGGCEGGEQVGAAYEGQQQQVALMGLEQGDQLLGHQQQQQQQHLMLDGTCCPQCTGNKCSAESMSEQQQQPLPHQAPFQGNQLINHNTGDLNSMHLSSLAVDDLDENELLECLAACDPEARLYDNYSQQYNVNV